MKSIALLMCGLSAALSSPALAVDAQGTGMFGVKIAVTDFQKTINFYTALGMKQGIKHNDHEWELDWADPIQGSSIIMVHDTSGQMRMVPSGAYLMIGVTDVNATLVKLKAAGFTNLGEPKVTPRATVLLLRDPDGNQIEMLSKPPG